MADAFIEADLRQAPAAGILQRVLIETVFLILRPVFHDTGPSIGVADRTYIIGPGEGMAIREALPDIHRHSNIPQTVHGGESPVTKMIHTILHRKNV